MKEIELTSKKDGFDYSKLLKKVAIAVMVIAIFIVLLATGQILFLLQIFGWVENQVRITTGLDITLAKGIAAVLMALILILPISGFIFSFFPFPQKNKKLKRFAVFAIFALLFFAAYVSSSNVFFDTTNGKPLKYYSISPNGEYKFYSSEGYDPVTGDRLQPINKKIIINYLKTSNGGDIGNNNSGLNTGSGNEKSLIGLEKYAKFYPVRFDNKTGRNIFICISSNANPSGIISIKFVSMGKNITLNLTEGRHIFGYMDINGDYYGDRSWGNILINANNDVGQRLPLKVSLDNKEYNIEATFFLEVLPANNQTVTLKTHELEHNKEMDPKKTEKNIEDIIRYFFIGLLTILLFFLIRKMVRSIKKLINLFKKPL